MALMTSVAPRICDTDLPNNYSAALKHPKREQWIKAAQVEMDDLKRRNVFQLVIKTPDIKPIPCQCVFDRKRNKHGNTIRHRGSVVAKGFKQGFWVDVYEIVSLVIRYTTVRIIFQIINNNAWKILRIDVRRALLYGELD